MNVSKVQKMLDLFFAFNDVEGKDSIHIEGSFYSDKFFRWTKDTFQVDTKFVVIYNKDRVVMFDRQKVKDRIVGNLDKVKSSPDKINHGIHPNVVSDLMMIINVEPFTEKDKLELEREIEIQTFNKNKRKAEYEKHHCTCNNPVVKNRLNKAGEGIDWCGICLKVI